MITFEMKEDRRTEFSYSSWYCHRRGKVAISVKCTNGKKWYERYYIHGKRHRLNGPAYTSWHDNGQKRYEGYRINGERHRLNGSAYTSWYSNGQKYCESYYIHDAFQSRKFWDDQGNPI